MESCFDFTMICDNREIVLKAPAVVAWNGRTAETIVTFDTGADQSCISNRLITELKLVPIRKTKISTVHRSEICNIYKAHIGFTPYAIAKNFEFAAQTESSDLYDVLIGMDLLAMGDFMFTNYGDYTTFSFRMPSQKSELYSNSTITKHETLQLLKLMRHIKST